MCSQQTLQIVQVAIGGMFGLAQPTLLSFPQERVVFLREYAAGQYSATAYFLSKSASFGEHELQAHTN